MGVLRMMNGSGDSEKHWDVSKPETVQAAVRAFKALHAKGFAVERVNGGELTMITAFNPAADEVLIVPQIRGGNA